MASIEGVAKLKWLISWLKAGAAYISGSAAEAALAYQASSV